MQGKKDMKITTVELTDMTDSDSKEEQDVAVNNICYERVPSTLNILHQVWWVYSIYEQCEERLSIITICVYWGI